MCALKKNSYITLLAGIAFFILLFVFSEEILAGINLGLLNCVRIIIPSLFPFLIASSLAGCGELPKPLKKLFEPVTQLLFRLPADILPAVFLGLFGGYLSGAKAIQTLCSNGIISKSQAERALLFCINAGMGFSINAVGNAMLCSRKAGKILFLSLCVSSLFIGIISRFLPDSSISSEKIKINPPLSFSSAVVNSVNSASQAMLIACGFVVAFSGIGAVSDGYIKNEILRYFISCLSEVTKGCTDITGKASLPIFAAVCAFGGICVHMQIFSFNIETKPLRFYSFRILHSVTAYAICRAVTHFYPVERTVFLEFSQNVKAFSFSAPAAISLLFLCFLLILDLDNNKKIC